MKKTYWIWAITVVVLFMLSGCSTLMKPSLEEEGYHKNGLSFLDTIKPTTGEMPNIEPCAPALPQQYTSPQPSPPQVLPHPTTAEPSEAYKEKIKALNENTAALKENTAALKESTEAKKKKEEKQIPPAKKA